MKKERLIKIVDGILRNQLCAGCEESEPEFETCFQCVNYAADEIIDQKLLRSPHPLNDAAEHPQGKHVEEDVGEVGMQELIGDELPEVEIGGKEEMQLAVLAQVELSAQHQRGHKGKNVDDKQVFGNSGYVAKHFSVRFDN